MRKVSGGRMIVSVFGFMFIIWFFGFISVDWVRLLRFGGLFILVIFMKVFDFGIRIGFYEFGKRNLIVDFGVKVGYIIFIEGDDVRIGVIVVLLLVKNFFRERFFVLIFVMNGFFKLIGFV